MQHVAASRPSPSHRLRLPLGDSGHGHFVGFHRHGLPTTGLSALFSEVADSLGLDLVEIGVIWGVGSVMGIFTSVLGGSFIDYFGTRRTLVLLCLATGISGALRGFAFDFWSLFITSFLFGMVQPILPMNFVKLNREWFASRQLGFASGVMSAGFATGLMLGSRLSATVLSPLLGGWRNVLIFLGVCAILMAVLWYFVHPPNTHRRPTQPLDLRGITRSLRSVARFRELWVISLAVFGVLGLMRGLVGYVPTYLREIGWGAVEADTAITVFFFCSLVSVVPLSHLSDRLGNRKLVMAFCTTMMSIGTALMFLVGDHYWGVLLAMALAGCCFDSFMALKGASITEVEGLDPGFDGQRAGLRRHLAKPGHIHNAGAGQCFFDCGAACAVSALGCQRRVRHPGAAQLSQASQAQGVTPPPAPPRQDGEGSQSLHPPDLSGGDRGGSVNRGRCRRGAAGR